MGKRVLISLVIVITVAAVLMANKGYIEEFFKDDSDIKVLDYKAPEVINERGYEISKCDGLNIKGWLDKNRVIVLKDKESDDGEAIVRGLNSYISIYDLNTKTYTDYKDTNVFEFSRMHSFIMISPNSRYVFYSEIRKTSEDDKEVLKARTKSMIKYNILDLSTGEIIDDFDKSIEKCPNKYRLINDDYVLATYGSQWNILNKQGDIIKQGNIDYNGCIVGIVHLIDVQEIKLSDNELEGKFYYEKEKTKEEDGKITEIYSMDINTNEETLIDKYDDYREVQKKDNLFIIANVKKDTNYKGLMSSCTLMDNKGNILQNYEVKDMILNEVQMSDNGEKCAFVEYNKIDLDGSLKVMDVKSGEIKEITKIRSLISTIDDTEIEKGTSDLSYSIVWDKTGTALAFNYSYTRSKDKQFVKNTYTVTFDK